MKIIITQNKGDWYWKIIARNGQTLAHSETYSSRAKAQKSVRSILKSIRENNFESKLE